MLSNPLRVCWVHSSFLCPIGVATLGFRGWCHDFCCRHLVPEAQKGGGDKPSALPSWGAIAGFVVMMSLDVAFG